jgi:hypothetical protein
MVLKQKPGDAWIGEIAEMEQRVGACARPPGSRDAVFLVTLPPGARLERSDSSRVSHSLAGVPRRRRAVCPAGWTRAPALPFTPVNADVRQRHLIGPVFNRQIHAWPAHLEKTADFGQT